MSKTTIAQAIDIEYASKNVSSKRKHIGMSQIGADCERQLWYSFNQCLTVEHDGRLLRLFQFGHDMEQGFADLLKSVGFRVYLHGEGAELTAQDPDNVFFSGTADAVAVSPDTDIFDGVKPNTPYVVDFKTASKINFNQFIKNGLLEWNQKYFMQLQCYMGFSEQFGKKPITNAMIFVFNKDNHEIATQCIEFNPEVFEAMRERANMLVDSEKPPVRLSDDPDFFKCRFCDYHDICHGELLAEPSCRNCGFGQKKISKGERCEKGFDMQPCVNHVFNPYMFDGDFIPIQFHPEHDALEYDGFVNCPPKSKDKFCNKPTLTSKEIHEIYLSGDQETIDTILKFAGKFDASVEWLDD